MKTRLANIAGLLAALGCAAAVAQSYRPFPGEPLDQRTRSMQERVEELYTSGNVERAYFIYRNDLAPLGDKYAQYMVGYMSLNGEGVEKDPVEALAWYRLAAERGETMLEKVRDELAAQLSPQQRALSDARFLNLWRRFGDRVLIFDLIERDMSILRAQTGTRIPGSGVSSPTLTIRPTGEMLGPSYYRDIERRLEARIAYLDTRVEIDDAVLSDELAEIRSNEARIKAEMAALNAER